MTSKAIKKPEYKFRKPTALLLANCLLELSESIRGGYGGTIDWQYTRRSLWPKLKMFSRNLFLVEKSWVHEYYKENPEAFDRFGKSAAATQQMIFNQSEEAELARLQRDKLNNG